MSEPCPGASVCCNPPWCKTTGKCLHQQSGQQPCEPTYTRAQVDAEVAAERERMNTHAVVLAETARQVERERCALLCENSDVFQYDDPGGFFARLIRAQKGE